MAARFDYAHGISAIDADLVRPRMASIHLLQSGDKLAVVDTGTSHAVPAVLDAIVARGRTPADVEWLVLTHIHLDHAGGAGALMQALPNARLLVHPRGARHMVDPARLIASATSVYGEETLRQTYGDILPIAAERVVESAEGMTIDFGERRWTLFDTPGHARHHHALLDSASNGIFTGDTFGLAYPDLTVDGRAFIVPTTTPVQFEPEAMRESVERLAALKPECLYLTHFGRIDGVPALRDDLLRRLDAHVRIGHEAARFETQKDRYRSVADDLRGYLLRELAAHGSTLDEGEALALLAMDIDLNAQGIVHWLATG
ncbi:MAG: MBL fold metallo-hydrolase [Betaproteobacteria bacterium]|nr:MBL fold metallo-hydrolase [Betaproteobacteria bacterium]